MLREITIGQYYPVDSVLHRMDPRTKLFGTMIFIISLFAAENLWAYILATVFLAAVIRLSRVPFSFMVRGLKAVFILLLISVSFNLFLTSGETVWQMGFLKITKEGIRMAVFMAIRLIYLVIGSSVMTLGIAMVASPGAPGGSIMTALPFLYMVFGAEAGDPNGPICAIMVALYITQDSFGTACNVSGDNAIGVIVDTIYKKFIVTEA